MRQPPNEGDILTDIDGDKWIVDHTIHPSSVIHTSTNIYAISVRAYDGRH